MSRKVLITGLLVFLSLGVLCAWVTFSHGPLEFTSDSSEYNALAVHMLQDGMYSVDGQQPFFGREPGQSVFLAVIYGLFGVENWVAIFAVQAMLHLIASYLFCREWGKISSRRAANITWFMLLIFPAVLHIIFAATRESLALSCCLFLLAGLLALVRTKHWRYALLAGIALGYLLLTYAPFILLPVALVPLLLYCRVRWQHICILLCTCAAVLSPWLLRNYRHQGQMCFAGCNRSAVFWSVRGQQAENIRGLEPLRCLWAEYISRDWSNRSTYCSFNGVMHRTFPDGIQGSEADRLLGVAGKQKIRSHFGWYIWFSVFEILELHLPYVNGWGFVYNVMAALTSALLYIGCAGCVRIAWRREYLIPLICMGYITGVFILTDATPRYLMPVIGCYIAFASLGFDWLMQKFDQQTADSSRQ